MTSLTPPSGLSAMVMEAPSGVLEHEQGGNVELEQGGFVTAGFAFFILSGASVAPIQVSAVTQDIQDGSGYSEWLT